jgi:hypothetical protein
MDCASDTGCVTSFGWEWSVQQTSVYLTKEVLGGEKA